MSEEPNIIIHHTQQGPIPSTVVPVVFDRRKPRRLPKQQCQQEEKIIRVKKNGKPSRRWQSREIERLHSENFELHKKIQKKEEIELRLVESKARIELELNQYRNDKSATNRERIKIMSQDIYLLKQLVVKLNQELEKYQDKYHSVMGTDGTSVIRNDSKPTKWIDGELTVLAPLLISYEETIKEKDELLKDAKESLLKLGFNCRELVKKNEELRDSISVSEKKGNVNYGEWLSVQKENNMLKEQNSLFLRHAKLSTNKFQTLKDSFQNKLDEVMAERDDIFNKFNKIKTDYSILKGRFSVTFEELDRIKNDSNDKIPNSVHTAYITECRRLLDELKMRYDDEKSHLLRKVAEAEAIKNELEGKIEQLNHEKNLLCANYEAIGAQVRCLKDAFDGALKDREALKEQLNCSIHFSKDLVLHAEGLIKELKLRTDESQFGSKLAGRVESLKKNMKNVEQDTIRQMRILDADLQKKVESISKIKNNFGSEISRLKILLKEKDSKIELLSKTAIDIDDSI